MSRAAAVSKAAARRITLAAGASHQRKAPVQHTFVAEAAQELRERCQLEGLALQRVPRALRRPRRERFQPFALPDRRSGKQAGVEPRPAIVQTLALLDDAFTEAPFRAVARAIDALRRPFQGQPDMARRQPDGMVFETGARALAEMAERLAEPAARRVEALARHGQQRLRARQSAFGAAKLRAKFFEMPPHASPGAVGAFGQPQNEIGMLRDRPFGRFRRRRRARIGHEVDQGPVGFVAHRRNQRDRAFRRRADHGLLIEAPEVFEAAAAARDDQQIRASAANPQPKAH